MPESTPSLRVRRTLAAWPDGFEPEAGQGVETVLFAFVGILAVATAGLQVAAIFGMPFVHISTIVLAVNAVWLVWFIGRRLAGRAGGRPGGSGRWSTRVVLVVTCGAGALIALILNRPDVDDLAYVPKALFYAENPRAVVDLGVHWLHGDGHVLRTGRLQYYELTQAMFAVFLGGHYLVYYHMVFPAVAGFLFVGSLFLAARTFNPRERQVLVGILVLLVCCLGLGESHFSLGNFSFVRMFQGKAVFLTLGISAWIYYSLRHLACGDMHSWFGLVATAIAMTGATSTAMVFLPFLSLLILVARHADELRAGAVPRDYVRRTLIYFSALVPLVPFVLEYLAYATRFLAAGSANNSMFPDSFRGHLQMFLGAQFPASVAVFLAVTLVLLVHDRMRIFFLAWLVAAFVLFLNPLVAPFIMEYATSNNIYWRLFYLVPLPLMVVVAGSLIAGRVRGGGRRAVAVAVLGGAGLVALAGPTSVLRDGNGAVFDVPRYKVDPGALQLTRDVLSRVPPGVMLAPREIAHTAVILEPGYSQVFMEWWFMRQMFDAAGALGEYERRIAAIRYLFEPGFSPDAEDRFVEILDSRHPPDHVVLARRHANTTRAREILLAYGYTQLDGPGWRYLLFSARKAGV